MAVIVAVFALLFTVGSFWWLNARPGRLIGSAPAVNGQGNPRVGGHENCALAAMRTAR